MEAFAGAWAAWAQREGRLKSMSSRTYLDTAEEFIDKFLRGARPAAFACKP